MRKETIDVTAPLSGPVLASEVRFVDPSGTDPASIRQTHEQSIQDPLLIGSLLGESKVSNGHSARRDLQRWTLDT